MQAWAFLWYGLMEHMVYQKPRKGVLKEKDLTSSVAGENMTQRTIEQLTSTPAQSTWMDTSERTSGNLSASSEQLRPIANILASTGQKGTTASTRRGIVQLGSKQVTFIGTMKTQIIAMPKRVLFQMDAMTATLWLGTVVVMMAATGIQLPFHPLVPSTSSGMVVTAKRWWGWKWGMSLCAGMMKIIVLVTAMEGATLMTSSLITCSNIVTTTRSNWTSNKDLDHTDMVKQLHVYNVASCVCE